MQEAVQVFDSIHQSLDKDHSQGGSVALDNAEVASSEGRKFSQRNSALSHQPTLPAAENDSVHPLWGNLGDTPEHPLKFFSY